MKYEVTCWCGERIKGETKEGVYEKAREHWREEQRGISPAGWAEVYEKIAAGRERAKAEEKGSQVRQSGSR